MMTEYIKLEIFIPEPYFPSLQKALQDVDAGHFEIMIPVSPTHGLWEPGVLWTVRIRILEKREKYPANRN